MNYRINIIQKLGRVSWGAHTQVLKTSSMSLVYSIAEYCAPVWRNSLHTKLINVQLNQAMRIISCTVNATPVCWLPVLCNIAPSNLRRREQTTAKLLEKTMREKNSLLYLELQDLPINCLISRHSIWSNFQLLDQYNIIEKWREKWFTDKISNYELIYDPTVSVGGFDIERREWSLLNRLRTGFGCCNELLHKWSLTTSPLCNCAKKVSIGESLVKLNPKELFKG